MRRLVMAIALFTASGGTLLVPSQALGGDDQATLGDAKALYALQRFDRARATFAALAEAGNAEAAFRLALMLEAGQGGPADPEAALDWLARAARAGHVPACELLAARRGMQEGGSLCGNAAPAGDPLLAQAEAGDARAMLLVARAKAAGEDGRPDLDGAVMWLKRAAATGDAPVKAYVAAALHRICAQPAAPPSCDTEAPETSTEATAPAAGADAGR